MAAEGSFNGGSGLVRKFEGIPGIVVTRTGGNNAERNTSTSTQDAIDSFVDGAITTDNDDGTIIFSTLCGKFLSLSLSSSFSVLALRCTLQAATDQYTVSLHVATIGSRIEND